MSKNAGVPSSQTEEERRDAEKLKIGKSNKGTDILGDAFRFFID